MNRGRLSLYDQRGADARALRGLDRARPSAALIAASLMFLHIVLVFPNHPDAIGLWAFLRIPLELPLIAILLYVAPAPWRQGLRAVLSLVLGCLVVLKIADAAAYTAFARPFHILLDLHLIDAGWNLLSGSIGTLSAGLLVAAAGLSAAATIWLVTGALGVLSEALPDEAVPRLRPRFVASAVALAVSVAAIAIQGNPRATEIADARAVLLLRDHARFAAGSIRNLQEFRAEAAFDAFRDVPDDSILAGLAGRDVLFLFVESYGRTVFERPLYAPTIASRLAEFEDTLRRTGFEARSGWLTAPMVGGQSWLAHASVLSGLWIDNQRRYDSLIVSDRQSLVHAFGRAGWRTVAAMPAISMAWPEGEYFGYDAIYDAAGLGYRGAPFNWVTMPDQYTLSALERLELSRADRPNIFAEVALISSHAPWTPIPPVIPWEEVGDGSVFTPFALSGDPPHVVWRDHDRVRAQYLASIDYALANLASYIEHFGRRDMVLVILGDHQPAPLVTGEGAPFDVPIHIISADPTIFDAIADWGWTPGLTPDPALAPWRMSAFRDRFLAAFTPEGDRVARLGDTQ